MYLQWGETLKYITLVIQDDTYGNSNQIDLLEGVHIAGMRRFHVGYLYISELTYEQIKENLLTKEFKEEYKKAVHQWNDEDGDYVDLGSNGVANNSGNTREKLLPTIHSWNPKTLNDLIGLYGDKNLEKINKINSKTRCETLTIFNYGDD